jgi:hypothetical protein
MADVVDLCGSSDEESAGANEPPSPRPADFQRDCGSMSGEGKRKGSLGSDEVRVLFCKKSKSAAGATPGGADATGTSAATPLEGLRVLVVAAGGISSQRAGLLARIAGGLGARACAALPGGGSAAVAELARAGGGGAGLTIVVAPNVDSSTLAGRLAGLGLAAAGAQTIVVKDAWLSACAEKKGRVDWKDFIHISCAAASTSSSGGGDRSPVAAAPCRELTDAPTAHRVRIGDVEVDAFGFGTMNLGAVLVMRPKILNTKPQTLSPKPCRYKNFPRTSEALFLRTMNLDACAESV